MQKQWTFLGGGEVPQIWICKGSRGEVWSTVSGVYRMNSSNIPIYNLVDLVLIQNVSRYPLETINDNHIEKQMKIVDPLSVIEMMYLRIPWDLPGMKELFGTEIGLALLWRLGEIGTSLGSANNIVRETFGLWTVCLHKCIICLICYCIHVAGLCTQMCSGSLGWIHCQACLKYVWNTLPMLRYQDW